MNEKQTQEMKDKIEKVCIDIYGYLTVNHLKIMELAYRYGFIAGVQAEGENFLKEMKKR